MQSPVEKALQMMTVKPPCGCLSAVVSTPGVHAYWYELTKGAEYFGAGKLLGKTTPIGATECAVVLRYLGFRAGLFDFTFPSPETGCHDTILEFCKRWFLSDESCRFPLYLQYGTSGDQPGGSLLVLGIYRSSAFQSTRTESLTSVRAARDQEGVRRRRLREEERRREALLDWSSRHAADGRSPSLEDEEELQVEEEESSLALT
ncbi:hypothetical protein GUITHDRAFT_105220 [Guillardia theta CCMP2712]|uniref:Uncharacterized protein n=1 Tax=Guillardia theta (strain CCMP2712) TaxID=905079 RepID=L1JKW2_GUITC|nr:hypothetical protein GUITHDRAFT_105220 [Guillardia theta CCMP2712]EKX49143.1 hypothetical protein GUITHDRAFT_105220 [Guillardia theta CCMP2712]|eukprot:XP_005836123.1 hypothetical protein GUITHDRAFT_105220 [Guillardia theta CCMP2712]